MNEMIRKEIGIGLGVVVVLCVSGALYFSSTYSVRPDREPDKVGEFQRIEGNNIIVKPLGRDDFPFKGMSRQEIREKMRASSSEEREAFRKKIKELLQDEIEVELADDVVIFYRRRKTNIEKLEAGMGIQIWLNVEGMNEVKFISARMPLNKKSDQ